MVALFFFLVAAASVRLGASLLRSGVVSSALRNVCIGGVYQDLKFDTLAAELAPWRLIVLRLRAIKTILVAAPMQNKCLLGLIPSLDLLLKLSLLLTKPLIRGSVELTLVAVVRVGVVEHHGLSSTGLDGHLVAGPPFIRLRGVALEHHISTTLSIVRIFLIFALLILII